MRRGDFPAAFARTDRDMAVRTGRPDDPALPYHERFVWDGRSFDGRRVLVRCYHGLGDTLQFCRFLPALAARTGRLELEVQPELLPLLRQVSGPAALHPFDPAHPVPPAECDLEIMELAQALRLPPVPAPFLRAAPDGRGAGRVGVCWSGGGWDRSRDVPFALLRPLLDGVPAVSLQRGPARAEAPDLPDPLDGSMDVLRLAGLIAGLDAVVTVDTMVAHLAGALGRPVLLLLKHRPDWRWGKEGAWYGSVRHFEQGAPGRWNGALRRARAALHATLLRPEGL